MYQYSGSIHCHLSHSISVCDSGLNHMETNIVKGLKDVATLTKLAVLCLYCQAISAPFAEYVCESQLQSQNALNLTPFYNQIIAHLETVINEPDLLLGPNDSKKTGTFNGRPWENPEAIHIIRNNQHHYPHLRSLLVAFFSGALKTWKRFTKEFEPGSKISNLTPEERYLAFRRPTNDINEGSLGFLRQMYRSFPNITLWRLNARLMIKFASLSLRWLSGPHRIIL